MSKLFKEASGGLSLPPDCIARMFWTSRTEDGVDFSIITDPTDTFIVGVCVLSD